MDNIPRNQRKTRAHRDAVPSLVPEYKGIDLVLGRWNRARILARVLKKRCVGISAQRVLYSGTSTLKPSVNFRAEKRSAQASAHPLSQAQGGNFLCVDCACLLLEF